MLAPALFPPAKRKQAWLDSFAFTNTKKRKYSLYSIVELNHCSFLNLRYPAPGLHDREILQ